MLACGYGWVYLLKEDGDNSLYKIGTTRCDNIEDRIKKLQTGNGNKIRLISSFLTNKPFMLEKMMHNKYQENREEGEWFLLNQNQIDSFLDDCKIFQKTIDDLEGNPFF